MSKKGRIFPHSIVSISISRALIRFRFRIDVHNWYAQVGCVCVRSHQDGIGCFDRNRHVGVRVRVCLMYTMSQ